MLFRLILVYKFRTTKWLYMYIKSSEYSRTDNHVTTINQLINQSIQPWVKVKWTRFSHLQRAT